ncbi:luciferase family protein [Acidothermus cellulolyticus 11B]|uniref:Luciferase family protein n=1 Tax=Acidothermus cellulolyticus (strain ATCC 43068 / DSM 8971 / 11B) TaxID=351607 RepID=A0LVF7_ACIC1|nr:LLM class flavin-dependent oxidoreductase [Acidothermus cellulolyticus]ABK53417.1 luciferase family protein [Acidothermus cellulolyticus 11B]
MTRFGLALANFAPENIGVSMDAVIEYALKAEQAGLSSVWVWDHLILGSKRAFPFLESLTTLSLVAAHTKRIELGTGVLVLPIREPVLLAKVTGTLQLASGGRLTLGMSAGWYEREFAITGVPLHMRGRIFERNLEILYRLWTEDDVNGQYEDRTFTHVRMLPRPEPRPQVLIGGYVDRVLKRVATKSDGWLTYFYTAHAFAKSWKKIRMFAEEAGRDPDELRNVAQLPICIDRTYEDARAKCMAYVASYFDVAEWSDSTPESSICGTPEQCAEQIQQHVDAGVQHIVFCPWNYEYEQVDRLTKEVLPMLDWRPEH